MATRTSTISSPIPVAISTAGHEGLHAPPKPSASDTVIRAQAGNPEAFSELYLQHKARVFSICMRIVHDFHSAEDLTQETFLQVHRKIASFRGDSVFTTWLHRLAVNTTLMNLRKRMPDVVSLDYLMTHLPQDRSARCFEARDLTQAGAIDRLAIDRAVATLPPGYRSIFLLHDVQGFDHGEIASMLKCTCGTTKSQLHKARRALRGALSAKIPSHVGGIASEYRLRLRTGAK